MYSPLFPTSERIVSSSQLPDLTGFFELPSVSAEMWGLGSAAPWDPVATHCASVAALFLDGREGTAEWPGLRAHMVGWPCLCHLSSGRLKGEF